MKNIVKKIVLIILVSLVGLFLMSLLVNRQAKKWQEFSPSISVPDLELPKTQSQEIVLKEFISPDGKLKLKYPSDWTEVNTTTFEGTLSEEAKKVFNPLFLAQKMKIENFIFSTLAVEELFSEGEKTPEEIVADIENYHQQKEKITILKLEKEEKKIIFEGSQGEMFGFNIFLKGAFLPTKENKTYLVIFTVFGKDWAEFQKDIEKVLESIELLE